MVTPHPVLGEGFDAGATEMVGLAIPNLTLNELGGVEFLQAKAAFQQIPISWVCASSDSDGVPVVHKKDKPKKENNRADCERHACSYNFKLTETPSRRGMIVVQSSSVL
jgi:hypothetical protein